MRKVRKTGQRRISRLRGSTSDALSSALRLINIRSRTEQELRDRLKRKGFSPEEVAETLRKLKEMDLINDRRTVREILHYATEVKGLGRAGVIQYMRQRGVPEDLICEVEIGPLEEEATAERLIRKRFRQMQGLQEEQKRRRLYGLLKRRGFSSDTIKKAIQRFIEEKSP